MSAPVKPFPTYKWRWLSVQPTEGLLEAPVFLGVLRALKSFENEPYSAPGLQEELKRVQKDTQTRINLARTPERNLFRNSGQYWRGTGLLESEKGVIQLTNLGRRVADGIITKDEFAALMIRNTVLPNPRTYTKEELDRWRTAGLRIKPFELILSLMNLLGQSDIEQAYLTPNELIKIVIPLSGAAESVGSTAKNIQMYRKGLLDVEGWPDCAPESNDKRLACEFLLFLEDFNVCRTKPSKYKYEQQFILNELFQETAAMDIQQSFLEDPSITEEEVYASHSSEIPALIERQRVSTLSIDRAGQARFRSIVLAAARTRCLLTHEMTLDVLEAVHIIPVRHGGTDVVGNGFCMRVDIHRLFDAGKIRIEADGAVQLNDQLRNAVSYAELPSQVEFPASVAVQNVEWRSRYL